MSIRSCHPAVCWRSNSFSQEQACHPQWWKSSAAMRGSPLRAEGFHTVAIDWKANRHRARQVVSQLDLSTDADQQKLFALLQDTAEIQRNTAAQMDCRPCGTATFRPDCLDFRYQRQHLGMGMCGCLQLVFIERGRVRKRESSFQLVLAASFRRQRVRRFVQFQMCMFGASRDQWLQLATNVLALSSLARICDHSHEHTPWGAAFRK